MDIYRVPQTGSKNKKDGFEDDEKVSRKKITFFRRLRGFVNQGLIG